MSLNKLCVVAGVGPGMGLAIARRFARSGFAIALIARDAGALARSVDEIRAIGVKAEGFPTDLCDLAQIKATFAAIRSSLGDPEVMVHNASVWREAAAMDLAPETFARDLTLSATSALACAQEVYPAMKAVGRGSLLFTGGGLALRPEFGKGVASLTAGKSALRGLVHALAGELAPDGVHVATVTIAGTVAPGGPFDPDLIAEHFTALHEEPANAWTVERVHHA